MIFPSWDPYVCVLSKHRAHFEEMGVTIPVPGFETVLTALDKHRTIEAARAAGFPCPRTYLYESPGQLRAIESREGCPLVTSRSWAGGAPWASRPFAIRAMGSTS